VLFTVTVLITKYFHKWLCLPIHLLTWITALKVSRCPCIVCEHGRNILLRHLVYVVIHIAFSVCSYTHKVGVSQRLHSACLALRTWILWSDSYNMYIAKRTVPNKRCSSFWRELSPWWRYRCYRNMLVLKWSFNDCLFYIKFVHYC
jgi:hypothetical protein